MKRFVSMRNLFLTVLISISIVSTLPANTFDHTHKPFDVILKKYVSQGLVNYKALKNDDQSLNRYLETLSNVSEVQYNAFAQNEKLAFLINAYNAFTLRLILDYYPIGSIGDIGSPINNLNLLRGTPWKKEFFTLLGKTRTLDWIEHEKLRKDFSEPRIHFAIVCASIGCPSLSSDAYSGKILEKQLQSAKLTFLGNPNKNSYNSEKNILRLSKIFSWFQGDFTKKGTLIEFVQEGFTEKIKEDATIEYNDYSWKLNEQK